MLLKKIHRSVKDNISETIGLIKDIKEIKDKVIFLEEQIKKKDDMIIELEKVNSKHAQDINILANDVVILSKFAKELWFLWEEMGLDEFDLFDLKAKKEKKKNNYH
jgi:hypothetical protein|tara:strand:- start:233 stop:550 length:318 start_codon:yes stop_codon:yes gene_type:complete